LPGRPTRGGGRAASTHPEEETVALEQLRLRELQPAVARRVVRAAARRLGARLSFEQTEQLLALAESRPGKFQLPGGITVERSLREIRLTRSSAPQLPGPIYAFPVPGEIRAPEYGLCLRGEPTQDGLSSASALLRPWKAGDRVTLAHSRRPRKVADVLDRLHVLGEARKNWPVVEWEQRIVWMRGVEVEAPEFIFTAQFLA
jgi:tRNA(Ile)-lysidine synthase